VSDPRYSLASRQLVTAVTVLASLAMAMAASSAYATSALRLDDVEQARISTAVVVATVGEARQALHPDWGRPVTFTTVRVEEVLRGDAPASLEIQQLRGERDGQVSRIPGDPELAAGERCVLFLRLERGDWFLTALGQSRYRIVREGDQERLVHDVGLALFERTDDGSLKEVDDPNAGRATTLGALRKVLSRPDARPRPGIAP